MVHSCRPVQVTVAKGSTGSVVKYPKVLAGWKVPANMAGEVILARLVLVGSKQAQKEGRQADYGAIEGAGVLAEQLYTFGVLAAGSNVNRPVNAVKPMAPLLHAPAAACTVSVPACAEAERKGRGKQHQHKQSDDGGTAVVTDDDAVVCSVTVSNTGSVPCLYVKLELRDQTFGSSSSSSTNSSTNTTAAVPQFHAAEFSTNYVTVFGQSSVDVTFERLPYHDAGEKSSWTTSLNV